MALLKVLSENVGGEQVFTDFTHFAYDFLSDSFRLVLAAGDSLYIAHPEKKINRLYFELDKTDSSLNHAFGPPPKNRTLF